MSRPKKSGLYASLMIDLFGKKYKTGATSVRFTREELVATAKQLGIALPKNVGDVIYSQRYRADLPEEIAETAASERESMRR